MKKRIAAVLLLLLTVSLCACGEKNPQKWDIALSVAEESSENSYVINWETTENILSETGCFSIQNRNLFDITVHLAAAGKEEFVLEIPAGGWFIQYRIEKNVSYQVGIHADRDAGTPLEITVYDGDNIGSEQEPYLSVPA